jgi:hypothetical protein
MSRSELFQDLAIDVGIIQLHVNLEFVRLVVMIPTLDPALCRRDKTCLRSSLIQRFARLSHLNLLEAIGHEDGNLLSAECQHELLLVMTMKRSISRTSRFRPKGYQARI